MDNPAGKSADGLLRLDFDRRVKLEFHGSRITSDAGLLACRELDDALGLSAMAGDMLADTRTGKNSRHALVGLLRQAVFGRLASYEDVNDAERLRHDPAMRWIVAGRATSGVAASPSQMGRFETQWLAAGNNLPVLTKLSGQWIERVHSGRPPRGILLDMDSSVGPTHGEVDIPGPQRAAITALANRQCHLPRLDLANDASLRKTQSRQVGHPADVGLDPRRNSHTRTTGGK